jgi:hypothetical protein
VCSGQGSAGRRQAALGRNCTQVRALLLSAGAWARVRDHKYVVCIFGGFKGVFRVTKANIQTRVNREHLGKILGLGETFYHIGNTY